MVELVFVANLVMALLGVSLCLWHAWPERERLSFLGTGVVYGVILEQLVILRFEAYHYDAGDFLLVLGDVPVVIGLGWAALIYAGYQIGLHFDLSSRALPPFVALFALHVDLAIDAIAIRVPFWTWTPPGAWFGVPLGNFTGWFLVSGLFVAAWLALRSRVPLAAVGPAAIVAAVAGLVVLLEGWTAVATTLPRKVAILGSAILVAVVVVAREGIGGMPVDPRIAAIPALYHGYYLALLLFLGIYREQPLLLVVSFAMIVVGGLVVDGRLGRRFGGTRPTP